MHDYKFCPNCGDPVSSEDEYLGVVQKDGDNYLIKSLGSAKKISDTTTSDDD